MALQGKMILTYITSVYYIGNIHHIEFWYGPVNNYLSNNYGDEEKIILYYE